MESTDAKEPNDKPKEVMTSQIKIDASSSASITTNIGETRQCIERTAEDISKEEHVDKPVALEKPLPVVPRNKPT